jgi:hypothetical protein
MDGNPLPHQVLRDASLAIMPGQTYPSPGQENVGTDWTSGFWN